MIAARHHFLSNIEGLRHDVPLRPKRATDSEMLGSHIRAAAGSDRTRMEPILMPLQDKTAEKMLNNVADFIAATQAKPDQRAWDQLLIYCPREALDRRASQGVNTHECNNIPDAACDICGKVGL